MSNTKDIQRRIKSVKNTGKITRAMEMVSATKMRKSVSSVVAIRPYAKASWHVLTNLTETVGEDVHGLLEVREVKNILMIVITSNKGLCGSFNSQILKKVREELENPASLKMNRVEGKKVESKTPDEDIKVDFITIGKKGEAMVKKLGHDIIAAFPELVYSPKVQDIRPLSNIISEEYLAKKYDKIMIAYTDHVSAMAQEPRVRQLLPISKLDLKKQIREMDETEEAQRLDNSLSEHEIEPSPEELLEEVVLSLLEMQIYHAILESNASKESSRMIAMKNATEAAREMVGDLTLEYNQIRQMKITQEIAEISAGRAALE